MAEKLPQLVQDAKASGKNILQLTCEDDRILYFQKPTPKAIERYIATATKGKPAQAVKNLVTELAIHPTGEELAKEFEDNPGKMVAINSALQASVGMNEDYTAKKL
jgi:hypothetical protein